MLALRFVQARLLSVWGLLLAAALCPPKVFADFAIFAALANFVSIAALLRFEAVFFQNSGRQHLGRAFRLALAAGAVFLGAMAVAILFAAAEGWVLRGFGALFLISLASRAAIRLILAEATAEGDFATIGNSNIVQALVQPGMMILLIWPLGPTALALFAADAFGHAVAAAYLAWRRRHSLLRLMHPSRWSLGEMRGSAGGGGARRPFCCRPRFSPSVSRRPRCWLCLWRAIRCCGPCGAGGRACSTAGANVRGGPRFRW
jgi:hypothetical protein